MLNSIIDIYHKNSIDFQEALNGGVVAIIHKATQGSNIRDSKYHKRREEAKKLGFLWGGYHFSTGEPVVDQVQNFLNYCQPKDDELISLDWEPCDGPDMTLIHAREFVQMIKNETGRWPVIYGGHLLREKVSHEPDSILSNCPLWYARYSSSPIGIPIKIWPNYTLWQYTDGDVGPEPHNTRGVEGADRNIFLGSIDDLKSAWPFTHKDPDINYGPGFSNILNPLSDQLMFTSVCDSGPTWLEAPTPTKSPLSEMKWANDLEKDKFGCTRNDAVGNKKFHGGIDIKAAIGTNCFATEDSVVTAIGYGNDLGKYVAIKFTKDGKTYGVAYCHLSKHDILSIGDNVTAGTVVGKTGKTGNVGTDASHLHLEVHNTEWKAYDNDADRSAHSLNPNNYIP
jgi:lysozyme